MQECILETRYSKTNATHIDLPEGHPDTKHVAVITSEYTAHFPGVPSQPVQWWKRNVFSDRYTLKSTCASKSPTHHHNGQHLVCPTNYRVSIVSSESWDRINTSLFLTFAIRSNSQ